MAFDIDSFIPSFKFFVFILGPTLMVLIFAVFMIRIYFNRKKGQDTKKSFPEIIGYIPIIYMFFPIYEIGEYLAGTRSSIVGRLFSYHFGMMMFLIVLTGICQVIYYWMQHGRTR